MLVLMRYAYPVMLDLEGKPCVVIGDSPLAEAKARSLEEAGAKVTRLPQWTPGALRGFLLAVSCSAQNAEIFAEAEREGVLLNAIDDPEHCRFIYPSVHRQGDLVVTVGTTGKCPALAVRLRDVLAEELGPEYAEFLEIVGAMRDLIAARYADFEERRKVWYALVDCGALELLKNGQRPEAEELLRRTAALENG